MIFPGGNDLLIRACEIVFDQFEALEAVATPGYRPRKFSDLPEADQTFWMKTLRPVIELAILATLTDQTQAVACYDGSMGAAYQAAVHRYALQELGHRLFQE